jgi:hypothetical protein
LPGDRDVRLSRHRDFRRVKAGYLIPRETVEHPRSGSGRLLGGLKRLIIGRPLATAAEAEERVNRFVGLAIFASDNISSSAYATEEIMRVLVLAGVGALAFTLPITLVICVVLGIVVLSYRQVIRAYPNGGGSYVVAKDNLGPLAGLAAGAATRLVRRRVAVSAPPSYEGPRPPSRLRPALALPVLISAGVLGCIGPELTRWCTYRRIGNSEPALLASLAWTGGSANELGRLAFLHFQRGDLAGAAALYRAAGEIDTRSVYHAANLALVLSHLQRPDEARVAAQEAEARCLRNGERPDERAVVEKAWESLLRSQMRLGPLRPERVVGGEGAEAAGSGGKD